MIYQSTRGTAEKVSSAYAIKNGIASDGGLYMPETIPFISLEQIKKLCGLSYPERAAYILSLFLDDYDKDELLSDCKAAYGDNFTDGIAPVSYVGDSLRVLELWHGPTCAFKDMALQLMPKLLSRALVKTGEKRRALILVATSGDTGKAALEGYRDVSGTAIMVFYPVHGVSTTQKRQMTTQEGGNVSVCAIEGNFDDAQTGVKKIFADKSFSEELDRKNIFLSSANSINWGRLAPQIVYYISAYCDMLNHGDIKEGELIDITVPTGNFGNILAAYITKKMGLPVGQLICASNSNDVLTDFFNSGSYDKNRKFYTTVSPSMDILVSSNLERLLYLIAGADKCAEYMESLVKYGRYTVEPTILKQIQKDFIGKHCSEEECLSVIGNYYKEYHYLCDTHTAVALYAAGACLTPGRRMLVDSTASPYKFAPAVAGALGLNNTGNDLEVFELISKYTDTTVPSPLSGVFSKKVRFSRVIKASDMENAVREFTEELYND